jgi:antitoxin PrlF
METRVTAKGQAGIPKLIRDRLGIAAGDAVAFEVAPDGGIVLVKAGGAHSVSRLETLRGRAGPGLSTDETMALTRGEDGS